MYLVTVVEIRVSMLLYFYSLLQKWSSRLTAYEIILKVVTEIQLEGAITEARFAKLAISKGKTLNESNEQVYTYQTLQEAEFITKGETHVDVTAYTSFNQDLKENEIQQDKTRPRKRFQLIK